jgi:glyoxylate reductase
MARNEARKPRVFVTRTLPHVVWEELIQHVDAEIWDQQTPPPYEILLQKVRDKEGLLCLLTDRIDERLIAVGRDLKVISQIAVGYDNIDIPAATAHGIRVGNTPGVLTDATADFTFALLMAAARRIGEGIDFVRQGRWQTWGLTLLLGQDVHGAALGLVGFGRIGQAVARRARGFDMDVLYYSRTRNPAAEAELGVKFCTLAELLQKADYVTLHVNLTPQTKGLIGARELQLMKPTAVLINTARGPVVDTNALYHALKNKQIAYAALDVTDPEPLPDDHKLLSLDNLIVVPHIASATVTSRTRMCMMAVENLLAGLNNEDLPFPVN